MDPRCSIAAALTATVAFLSTHVDKAEAAIRVKLSFVWVEHEIYPNVQDHRTPQTLHYDFNGKGLSFHSNSEVHDTRELGRSKILSNSAGKLYRNQITLEQNSFKSISRYPDFTIVTTVVTNGVDSCQAKRVWTLNPGRPYYVTHRKSNGEEMHDSGFTAEGMECTISN